MNAFLIKTMGLALALANPSNLPVYESARPQTSPFDISSVSQGVNSYFVSDRYLDTKYMFSVGEFNPSNPLVVDLSVIGNFYGYTTTLNFQTFASYDNPTYTAPWRLNGITKFSLIDTQGRETIYFDNSEEIFTALNPIEVKHERNSNIISFSSIQNRTFGNIKLRFYFSDITYFTHGEEYAFHIVDEYSFSPVDIPERSRIIVDDYQLVETSFNQTFEDAYHQGYEEGKQDGIIGGSYATPFSLITQAFNAVGNFFLIEIFPHVTLGALITIPIAVGLIIVVFRLVSV